MRVIRSFLALKLGLSAVENLTATQKELRRKCREANLDIRWVPPPNIHVTLRFLGQITEPMSHAVKDMLEPIVSGIEAFELECTGLGVFPNEQIPRVVWAGLGEGSDKLREMYNSIYSRLLTAGFNFEDKPFSPHVTLGRVKHASPDVLVPLLNEIEQTNFGVSTVRHFYCYQSDLLPHGAEYTAQWVLPFRKKPNYRHGTAPLTQSSPVSAPASNEENQDNDQKSGTHENPQPGE